MTYGRADFARHVIVIGCSEPQEKRVYDMDDDVEYLGDISQALHSPRHRVQFYSRNEGL